MSRASLIVLVLLVSTVPASLPAASEAAAPPLPAPRGPLFRVDAAGTVLDAPASPAEALRDALALAAGAPFDPASPAAVLRAVAALAPDAATPALDSWPGYGIGHPQGDADGDGASEALVVHYPQRGGNAYTLRMVGDAETLWTRDVTASGLGVVTGVDLDGDALTDALVLTLSAEGRGAVRYEWRLLALRGHDGTLLWERVEKGAIERTALPGGGEVATAPALYFIPLVGPDADGDGGVDVWLNLVHVAAARRDDVATDAEANRVEVLSGATGGVVSSALVPAADGGFSWGLPSEDLSGDGLGDTVVTAIPRYDFERPTTLVAALHGRLGAPLWARALPAIAVALPQTDLTGDGLADVIAHVVVPQAPDRREALDGANGLVLWTFAEDFFLFVVPGNVDGVAGADVLFVDADYVPATRHVVARVLAVAGETGATLYDESPVSVPLPTNGYTSVELGVLAGDFDADGVLDTTFNTETGAWPERFTGDINVVRGSDGTLHWSLLGDDLWAFGVRDLTGDGRDDLLQVRIAPHPEPWAIEITALDGVDGAAVWTRSPDVWGIALKPGAAFGGLDGHDVLVTILTEGDEVPTDALSTRLEVWDGPDASVVWAT